MVSSFRSRRCNRRAVGEEEVVEARRLSPSTEIPAVGATVGDFWAWAFSDVLSNTARGVLAEFLVGSALGVVDGVRVEWDPFDLHYEGAKIEIKSAAYVQRWFQKKHSVVEWKGIGEQRAWNAATGTYSEEKKRWADCYVLCLYTERDRDVANALDVSRWEFYVLSTKRIYRELGTQKSVGLGKISRMTEPVGYGLLKERVDQALNGAG
jgi:hypothetical protein